MNDEKLRNWQSAYVEFFDEEGLPTTDLIFCGPKSTKYYAFSIDESGNTEEVELVHEKIKDPSDKKGKKEKPSLIGVAYGVKLFIGNETPSKKQASIPLYAKEDRGDSVINYVVPSLFEGKNIVYVQVVK